MAAPTEQQVQWVSWVLGVDVAASSAPPPNLADALAGWREALEKVDQQIAALQGVLRSAPDPDLRKIGEFGLNAITMNTKVRLQAALIDGGTSPPQRIAKLSLASVAAFTALLREDRRVAACDGNPFGVKLSMRATLLPALATLRRALQPFA